jgi:hypothetical protein
MDYREDYERGRSYREEGADREFDRREGRHRRDWDRRRDDREGFLERFVDEVRSWFHDDDSQRHRGRERDEARGWGGGARGWGGGDDAERDWARQWGYVEGREREPRSRQDRGSERGGSWTRETGYGGEGFGSNRYAGDRYYEPRSGWGDPSAWGAERRPDWQERWRGSEAGTGPHAGRGPRGYQRSDERIREDVCDRLCEHGYVDASQIEVTVQNGEVTLVGTVCERPEKRMAEDAAESVAGVREVHNQLRVSPGGSGQEPQSRSGDPRFRIA